MKSPNQALRADTIINDKTASVFSLFGSTSTLICCALPALFVAIGAGATFVSLISTFPFLVTMSKYKLAITLTALVFIVFAGYINYKTYYLPCPLDQNLAKACMKTRKRTRVIYYVSVAIFAFATLFSYVVPLFL